MTRKLTEFFQHPRYRINSFLLCCNGQWPFQKFRVRVVLLFCTFACSFTIMIAQVREIVIGFADNDLARVIAAAGPLFVNFASLVKVTNSIVNGRRIRRLLEFIYDHWHTPMGREEKVLAEYSDNSRFFTIVYTVSIYFSMTMFIFLCATQRIMSACGWVNVTQSNLFPAPVDYGVDEEEYYYYIQFHVCTVIVCVITTLIAADVLFVMFVQHACGMLAAIGYRLEHMIEVNDVDVDVCPSVKNDENFRIVADCIKKHNEALEFVKLLGSAYSTSFLLVLGINMFVISFTGIQVIRGAAPGSFEEAFRQAVFGGAQVIHLLFESLFSQKLTDHSVEIFESINRSQWYNSSLRTRKLLNFMLLRSMKPWELKAGKMFAMSLANFSNVIRTSLSYLTLLNSVQ